MVEIQNLPPSILTREDGATIAYHRRAGRTPGVVFLGGFMSDMGGTKALALDRFCAARGQAFVRFDYFGHGQSSGDFAAATVSRWRNDALAVFDNLTEGPQVLVGSSLGGWIMLLLALARPARVTALVGIAAAADATEDLMWAEFPAEVRQRIERDGAARIPSAYSEQGYLIARGLIEDGRRHLLTRSAIAFAGPVRLLHGMRDADVPWQRSLALAERLAAADVQITLVKDGDHRLSRDADLALLTRTLATLLD
ncbi:MAG: alpha/beta hydrolase [Alphaproteobacteria bacterium]|nr:alpha/beta hydrolase [Alphaproteobacteria bacterium]